ncbi:hypothetical protein WA026_007660 [Henosepilachna vigintioctopunctata]|uniref:Reverse transcriptase domain-containing protein n=1 Tax=Henosepilachna vigintioctopunctata TaxID=420089 RepID=A0AAW1TX17_9CUCU
MFADDLAFIVSDKDGTRTAVDGNRKLQVLVDRFSENSLYFNLKKTNYIRFHNVQNRGDMNIGIEFDDIHIELKPSLKFLGIGLDEM